MGSAMNSDSSYSQNALPPSYIPHGRYAGVDGSSVPFPDTGIVVSESCRATVRLRKDKLGGREITYISKLASDGPLLYRELYMYSHPELLRQLQGTCVSYVIGVSEPREGRVAVAMEMPHPVGWKEADAYESDAAKNAIIRAYQTLHSRGILHGHVEHEHVLLANDGRIVLIDFTNAATVADHTAGGIRRCDPTDLSKEMEQVKTLVGYVENASTSSGASPMEVIGDGVRGRFFDVPEDRRSVPWENPSSSAPRVSEPLSTATQDSPADPSDTLAPVANQPKRPTNPPPSKPTLLQPPSLQPNGASSSTRERTPTLKSAMAKPLHEPSAAHLANSKANKWVDKRGHARVAFHPDTQDNSLWTAPGLFALYNSNRALNAQSASAATTMQRPVAQPAATRPPSMSSTSGPPAPLTYREPEPYRQPDEPRPAGPSTAAEKAPSAPEDSEDLSVRIVITAPTGEECVWGVSKEVSHTIQKLLTGTQGGKRLPRGAESTALKRKPDDTGDDKSTNKKLFPGNTPSDSSAVATMAAPSAGPSAPRKRKAGDASETDENGGVSRAEEKSQKRFLANPLQRTVPVS